MTSSRPSLVTRSSSRSIGLRFASSSLRGKSNVLIESSLAVKVHGSLLSLRRPDCGAAGCPECRLRYRPCRCGTRGRSVPAAAPAPSSVVAEHRIRSMPLNVQIAAACVPPSMKLRYVHSLPTLMPRATAHALAIEKPQLAVFRHAGAEHAVRAAHLVHRLAAALAAR